MLHLSWRFFLKKSSVTVVTIDPVSKRQVPSFPPIQIVTVGQCPTVFVACFFDEPRSFPAACVWLSTEAGASFPNQSGDVILAETLHDLWTHCLVYLHELDLHGT